VNVGVYRKRRSPQREEQDDRGGLGANPIQVAQPGTGLGKGQLAQEIERQLAAFSGDAAQDGLEARPLAGCQSGGTDGGDHLFEGRVAHRFPGGKPRAQLRKRQIAVAIVGVLAQEGVDQLGERVGGVPRERPIAGCQPRVHFQGFGGEEGGVLCGVTHTVCREIA